MATSGRSSRRTRLNRGTTLGLAAAATAASLVAGGASASASPSRATSEYTGTLGWATTATRALTLVDTVFPPTPVHPEAITHPNADFMGSTVQVQERAAIDPAALDEDDDVAVPQLPGIDVSSYQGPIEWASVSRSIDFAYAKASEGTYYLNPDFANQYDGPYDYGVIRGAYHFAVPNNSSGQTQADYFIDNGGGWSGDGRTLPGALDIEYNPYGTECYGLTPSQMITWISNFVSEYAGREHVYPVIYTATAWWTTCTGNYAGFAGYDPLWIPNYSAGGPGRFPAGWGYRTIWQYADSGSLPGDQDVFNGTYSRLQALAKLG
jgi:GH25 family lysozyme M1 (1,4-beta-N-acetylmuramidase)